MRMYLTGKSAWLEGGAPAYAGPLHTGVASRYFSDVVFATWRHRGAALYGNQLSSTGDMAWAGSMGPCIQYSDIRSVP